MSGRAKQAFRCPVRHASGIDMTRAVLIMLLAMSCIPAGDAASKLLTTEYSAAPVYVVWTRFALGALCLLPFTFGVFRPVWRNPKIWMRAALIGCGITCITVALSKAPLADVFGAFFIGPIVSFVLSVWLLKEQAKLAQWVLMLLGFAGVLVILRPGLDVSPGLGWALLAGCFYGCFLTASRWLAGQVPLGALMLSQMLLPAIVSTPLVLHALPEFSADVIWLTFASALGSMVGNALLLYAYRMQDATRLAPFVYFQLPAAVILGYLIFGSAPDIWVLAGLCVIIVGGAASAFVAVRPANG